MLWAVLLPKARVEDAPGQKHVVFRMLTQKSNKTQTKSLPIRMEAGLATRTLAEKQKAVEEQRQLKRLVEALQAWANGAVRRRCRSVAVAAYGRWCCYCAGERSARRVD